MFSPRKILKQRRESYIEQPDSEHFHFLLFHDARRLLFSRLPTDLGIAMTASFSTVRVIFRCSKWLFQVIGVSIPERHIQRTGVEFCGWCTPILWGSNHREGVLQFLIQQEQTLITRLC